MSGPSIFKRFFYRVWQFYKSVRPDFKEEAWDKALAGTEERFKPYLFQLRKAEKAHVLRILKLIKEDSNLTAEEKKELSEFALIHDIGKSITKPSLIFKVAKVLFNLNGNAHCIAGARLVWRLTANKTLAVKILRHHSKAIAGDFIAKFQCYDDRA